MDDNSGGNLVESNIGATIKQCWRGCSMQEIYGNLNEFELEHVQPVRPSAEHTVLHCYPLCSADNQPPRPQKTYKKWDSMNVRMPCSTKSQYPVTASDGSTSIEPRWQMITKALQQPITNSYELQAVILTYNSKYANQWNFCALHRLFEKELDESETQVFFEDLLPRIIRLALRLPRLVKAPIPLLKQGHTHSVTLTQQQISCLLANAFLCTFPRRNTLKRKSEYSTFPDINFNRLFQSTGQCVLEKIKCICHYFRRVCPTECDSSNVPTGVVTFSRRSFHYSMMPRWEKCETPLGVTPLHITADGTIEDQGLGLLQVDFANKYLGGGVLGCGCVQEEIRFVICPELIISKLFTECLKPTEALLMVGAERYSNYTGYANSFQWDGNHEDATPRDSSGRRMTHIVAIDALAFSDPSHQYHEEQILRELNKAYVGFFHTLATPAPGVASGNWGCGAFRGEARLKALLQLMACTVTKRPLVYYTFGDKQLRDDVHRMHTFFIEKNVRVCELWSALRQFKTQRTAEKQLYEFIYGLLSNKESERSLPKPKTTSPTAAASSAGTSEPSCSTFVAAQTARKSPKGKDTSRDLFASSSSSSSAAELADGNGTNTVTSRSMRRLSFSSGSESDVILLAAVGDTLSAEQVTSKSVSQKSLPTGHRNAGNGAKDLRQRTLLEMLDQCYTDGSQLPANKRHCSSHAMQH